MPFRPIGLLFGSGMRRRSRRQHRSSYGIARIASIRTQQTLGSRLLFSAAGLSVRRRNAGSARRLLHNYVYRRSRILTHTSERLQWTPQGHRNSLSVPSAGSTHPNSVGFRAITIFTRLVAPTIKTRLKACSSDMNRQVRGENLNIAAVLTWGPDYYYQKQFFSGHDDKLSTPYLPDALRPRSIRFSVRAMRGIWFCSGSSAGLSRDKADREWPSLGPP